MAVNAAVKEALQQAIAEHAAISEYIDDFSHAVPWLNEHDLTRKIKGMRFFLKKHVLDHFAFEEQRIFPLLLEIDSSPATKQVVSDLQREHAALLREAGKLNEALWQIDRGDGGPAALAANRLFREFLSQLQKHARQEDNLFMSPLQGAR